MQLSSYRERPSALGLFALVGPALEQMGRFGWALFDELVDLGQDGIGSELEGGEAGTAGSSPVGSRSSCTGIIEAIGASSPSAIS